MRQRTRLANFGVTTVAFLFFFTFGLGPPAEGLAQSSGPNQRQTPSLLSQTLDRIVWQEYQLVKTAANVFGNPVFVDNGRFDRQSWRANVQPGLWLPAYIYSEESDLRQYGFPRVSFRSQTRFWGYQPRGTRPEEELTSIQVDAPTPVEDASDVAHDNSPIGSSRIKIGRWTDSVELMKTRSVALISPRDKMPFEVTPLIPCLTRLGAPRPEQQARR